MAEQIHGVTGVLVPRPIYLCGRLNRNSPRSRCYAIIEVCAQCYVPMPALYHSPIVVRSTPVLKLYYYSTAIPLCHRYTLLYHLFTLRLTLYLLRPEYATDFWLSPRSLVNW